MVRDVHAASARQRQLAMRSRAWLDDVEVTDRCFYADDKHGIVRLFRLNAEGQKYVDPDTTMPATEECRGLVRIGRAE